MYTVYARSRPKQSAKTIKRFLIKILTLSQWFPGHLLSQYFDLFVIYDGIKQFEKEFLKIRMCAVICKIFKTYPVQYLLAEGDYE